MPCFPAFVKVYAAAHPSLKAAQMGIGPGILCPGSYGPAQQSIYSFSPLRVSSPQNRLNPDSQPAETTIGFILFSKTNVGYKPRRVKESNPERKTT